MSKSRRRESDEPTPARPQFAPAQQPGDRAALIRAIAAAALSVARQRQAAGVVHLHASKQDEAA